MALDPRECHLWHLIIDDLEDPRRLAPTLVLTFILILRNIPRVHLAIIITTTIIKVKVCLLRHQVGWVLAPVDLRLAVYNKLVLVVWLVDGVKSPALSLAVDAIEMLEYGM